VVVHVDLHHVPAMCNVAGHGDDCFLVGFGLDDCVPLYVDLVLYLCAVPAQKADYYVGFNFLVFRMAQEMHAAPSLVCHICLLPQKNLRLQL